MMLALISLFLPLVHAGEWLTTSGQFCINKCEYVYDNHHYFWCHVSDPTGTYTDGNPWGSWSYEGNSPDTHLKWDYCVPSELDDFQWQNNQKPNYNVNDTDYKPKGAATALYPFTFCKYGECSNRMGSRFTCPLPDGSNHPLSFNHHGEQSFYCVDEQRPMREQLGAKSQFWCLDPCRKESRDHYFCLTLIGDDHCSPQEGLTSSGTRCEYPCEYYSSTLGGTYSFCYTQRDKSDWDYCGNWTVPAEKKHAVEYTRYDYVCADFCQVEDDYQWCHHVYWDYNSTTNEATLRSTWDYCLGFEPESMEGWKIALIVLGVIVAIVAVVGIVIKMNK